MNRVKDEIFSFIPERLVSVIDTSLTEKMWQSLEEIRIYKKGKIVLSGSNYRLCAAKHSGNTVCPYLTDESAIDETIRMLTGFSPYAYGYHMSQGYLTAPGGHRVGFTGEAIIKDRRITNIKNISALNIRVSKPVPEFGRSIVSEISTGTRILNTIVISPPKCGKTTLLRNIARMISNSDLLLSVGIIDERGELCACRDGIPWFDVGANTSVIEGCPKEIGVELLIKSMAPEVIICDEISSEAESNALMRAIQCGVSVVFSAHGKHIEDLVNSNIFSIMRGRVEYVVELSCKRGTGTIERAERCAL